MGNLTKEKDIFKIVTGYKTLFLLIPHYAKTPVPVRMTKTKPQIKGNRIKELLEKSTMRKVENIPEQYDFG